jgi:hypothetical protein
MGSVSRMLAIRPAGFVKNPREFLDLGAGKALLLESHENEGPNLMFRRQDISRSRALLLSSVLSAFFVLSDARPQRQDDPYEFSFPCQAQTFFIQDAGKPVANVRSPDRQKRVVLDDASVFAVVVHGRRLGTLKYYEMNSNIYVGWSPDSSQFFIMYSDGDWHVHMFTSDDDRVRELSLPQVAFKDFKKKHSCQTRDNSVLFLSWTPDSQKVFLVTEVHPTSDCGAEAGRFQGYLMQVQTGEILRRFNEKETTEIEKGCRATKMLKIPTEGKQSCLQIRSVRSRIYKIFF